MGDTAPGTVAELEALLAEEERLVFPYFDHQTAWDLGSDMRTRALANQLPVVISIRRNGQRLFYAALPGSASDNDAWIDRKSAVVDRFGHSSYYIGCKYRAEGKDFDTASRLNADLFAAHGGAFPLIIAGTGPVGVIAVSGLPQAEDHRFVVTALERFLS
jgi:uncharacterized protein (UPF0303 family)